MIRSMAFYNKILKLFTLESRTYSESSKFSLQPYKLFKLESGPNNETHCTRKEALKLIRQMFQIRRMETACGNLYKEKLVRGFCHLSSGQEAIAVGIEAALEPQDSIITSYRCHGFTMMRGSPIRNVVAELLGKSTGVVSGKGGSMHMYGKNFYGGNGIVGAQVPLGAGVAFAHRYKKDNGMCLALYGDGAANQGQVFEAYNIAKLWNLPCIFICENNHYGMGTSALRSSASTNYYTRGDYIPGLWLDGMDVLTVREAIRFGGQWCRSGKGPLVLEMETYRYSGHSMSDPGTSYRTREEVQDVRKEKDCISHFSKTLTDSGLVKEDEIKAIENEVKDEVNAAVEQAKADAVPDTMDAYLHIHSTIQGTLTRGCDNMTWIKT